MSRSVNRREEASDAKLLASATEETALTVGSSSDECPQDTNSLVWYAFLAVGLALLTPWNTVISTNDFWTLQFQDNNILFYFSIGTFWYERVMLVVRTRDDTHVMGGLLTTSVRTLTDVDFALDLHVPVLQLIKPAT
jgi:hypothetical protein